MNIRAKGEPKAALVRAIAEFPLPIAITAIIGEIVLVQPKRT